MVASTEVITGKRTIMEYLMKPVLRARDRALRER
jgi:adhesin transport system membrane fusion protein